MLIAEYGPTPKEGLFFRRENKAVRLFAIRPVAIVQAAQHEAGRFKCVLQPVERGMVQAWKPLWEEWLTPEEVEARKEALLAEGWAPVLGKGALCKAGC